MTVDRQSVCMLHFGDSPHPAHAGFAEAIGADLVSCNNSSLGKFSHSPLGEVLNGLAIPDYDVYIAEGSRALYTGIAAKISSGSNLIFLCGDHRLREMVTGSISDERVERSIALSIRSTVAGTGLRNVIDGVIAVSSSSAEFIKNLCGPRVPVVIANPYIQPDVYETLRSIPIQLDSQRVVTVSSASKGSVGYYKGVDLLVDAWPSVRRQCGDVRLEIVGRGHDESFNDTVGVRVRGYIEDLSDAFSPMTLYVQPSRREVFGVTVVEAMAAGVPPLVTESTGSSSVVSSVDPSLVVRPTVQSLQNGIVQYLERPLEERKSLARRYRNLAQDFTSKKCKLEFRNQFHNLMSEINGSVKGESNQLN